MPPATSAQPWARGECPPLGTTFARLTVIAEAPKRGYSRYVICRCDCGNASEVSVANLKSGHIQSCGCLRNERVAKALRKHGHCSIGVGGRTPTFNTWRGMLDRCSNSNHSEFKRYGARGISVCKAWRDSFSAFLNDMGERPTGRSIDRIDNRFGYFFSNCRWSTPKQQAANRGGKFAA